MFGKANKLHLIITLSDKSANYAANSSEDVKHIMLECAFIIPRIQLAIHYLKVGSWDGFTVFIPGTQ